MVEGRGSRVEVQGSRVKGQGSMVEGQGSRVKGHGFECTVSRSETPRNESHNRNNDMNEILDKR